MLDKIWSFLIIISFIFMISTGNAKGINESIFKASEDAIEIIISFFGTICLWNGMMRILSKTTLNEIVKKVLKPIMRVLFPKMKSTDEEYQYIIMNIVANFFGLGNAATPAGLKAMEKMQEKNVNKDVITNDMAMLIVLNTSSIQLIPTTVIAIRNSLSSANPTGIIIPIWFTSICAAIIGIGMTKIFQKKF